MSDSELDSFIGRIDGRRSQLLNDLKGGEVIIPGC